MTFSASAVYSALTSEAKALGVFRAVMSREPKAAPQALPALAIWWNDPLQGIRSSGLASMSVKTGFRARLYQARMLPENDADEIALLANTEKLFAAYAANFTAGGVLRCVDLLGMEGSQLDATPGWITHEQTMFRVAEFSIPLIINDAFAEVP